MNSALRILVVDDMKNVVKEISSCFKKFGYTLDIEFHCPDDRDKPYGGCELPKELALDDFDFAFIDLEIFPGQVEAFHYSPEDLRGGTEILPYLRRNAPWLPVLGYSRLFTEKSRDWLLEVATGFGFDGYASRNIFSDKSLTKGSFDELLGRLKLQRMKHTLGYAYSGDESIQVDISDELGNELGENVGDYQRLLRKLFFFAGKIVVEPLRCGWSGASVVRVFAKQAEAEVPREGEWLVKLSTSPWKLTQEANAHFHMMRSGFDSAMYTPMLYGNVVGFRNHGAIVYQFAKGTLDGIEFLEQTGDAEKLARSAVQLLVSFYGQLHSDRNIASKMLAPWLPSKQDMRYSAMTLGSGRIYAILSQLITDKFPESFSRSVKYQKALIHGDLHCGNIMIGKKNLLIDFAHCQSGPIVLDLAKLVSDLVVRCENLQSDNLPTWMPKNQPIEKVLKLLREKFALGGGEQELFDTCLGLLLAQSLNYDSVSDKSKQWICQILKADE